MFWKRKEQLPADYMIVIAEYFGVSECNFTQVPFCGTEKEANREGSALCYRRANINGKAYTVVDLNKPKLEGDKGE